jgi:hypothetical protein
MEKIEETLELAINRYTDVAKANQLAQEVHDLHQKIRLENKNSKPDIIFSCDLEMPVVGTDHGDRITTKTVLEKAEISFKAFYTSGRFSVFYLTLSLFSSSKHFMFDIAKSKEGYSDYQVCYKEDHFRLQCGDGTFVVFNSKEDLQFILNFCYDAIAIFNKKLSDDCKLVTHLEVFHNY